MEMLKKVTTMKAILIVILGGLFGWMLGQLPVEVVYGFMAVAIVWIIVFVVKK